MTTQTTKYDENYPFAADLHKQLTATAERPLKPLRVLRLNLKREYWEDIRDGKKPEEFRLQTPYWEKRLSSSYDEIHLLWGYPKKYDESRIIRRVYRGYTVKTITHKHFGDMPVSVFAIKVSTLAGKANK